MWLPQINNKIESPLPSFHLKSSLLLILQKSKIIIRCHMRGPYFVLHIYQIFGLSQNTSQRKGFAFISQAAFPSVEAVRRYQDSLKRLSKFCVASMLSCQNMGCIIICMMLSLFISASRKTLLKVCQFATMKSLKYIWVSPQKTDTNPWKFWKDQSLLSQPRVGLTFTSANRAQFECPYYILVRKCLACPYVTN